MTHEQKIPPYIKIFSCISSQQTESNVLTLKSAVHYAPTDIPTIFLGSYARKPFELVFGGKEDPNELSVDKQLSAFVDLTKAFLSHTTNAASSTVLSESISKWDNFLIRGTDYIKKKSESAAL